MNRSADAYVRALERGSPRGRGRPRSYSLACHRPNPHQDSLTALMGNRDYPCNLENH